MRLINADALYETLCHIWDRTDSEDFEKAVFREIENAPVVEERKTGTWKDCGVYADLLAGRVHQCSICGAKFSMANEKYMYCPNCGSKMEETHEPK